MMSSQQQQATRSFGRKRVAVFLLAAAAVACMAGQKEYIGGHGRPAASPASPRQRSSGVGMAAGGDPMGDADPRYFSSNYNRSGPQSIASNSGAFMGMLASVVVVGLLTVTMGITKIDAPTPSTINAQGSFRVMQPAMDKLQKQVQAPADKVIEDIIRAGARK